VVLPEPLLLQASGVLIELLLPVGRLQSFVSIGPVSIHIALCFLSKFFMRLLGLSETVLDPRGHSWHFPCKKKCDSFEQLGTSAISTQWSCVFGSCALDRKSDHFSSCDTVVAYSFLLDPFTSPTVGGWPAPNSEFWLRICEDVESTDQFRFFGQFRFSGQFRSPRICTTAHCLLHFAFQPFSHSLRMYL